MLARAMAYPGAARFLDSSAQGIGPGHGVGFDPERRRFDLHAADDGVFPVRMRRVVWSQERVLRSVVDGLVPFGAVERSDSGLDRRGGAGGHVEVVRREQQRVTVLVAELGRRGARRVAGVHGFLPVANQVAADSGVPQAVDGDGSPPPP